MKLLDFFRKCQTIYKLILQSYTAIETTLTIISYALILTWRGNMIILNIMYVVFFKLMIYLCIFSYDRKYTSSFSKLISLSNLENRSNYLIVISVPDLSDLTNYCAENKLHCAQFCLPAPYSVNKKNSPRATCHCDDEHTLGNDGRSCTLKTGKFEFDSRLVNISPIATSLHEAMHEPHWLSV
jgi:hypothetical protein